MLQETTLIFLGHRANAAVLAICLDPTFVKYQKGNEDSDLVYKVDEESGECIDADPSDSRNGANTSKNEGRHGRDSSQRDTGSNFQHSFFNAFDSVLFGVGAEVSTSDNDCKPKEARQTWETI